MKKQKMVFLEGGKAALRLLDKETDLEPCLRWVNDQDVIQYLTIYLPTYAQDKEKWFDDLQKRKNDIILGIETLDGKFIGITGLYSINWKDRIAMHEIIIGEKDYWGRGYGIDSHMILLDYAFNTLNLRKICSSAISFNERSLKYHLNCGYQVEGTLRKQIFKNGEYRDRILLSVFKDEWLEAYEKYKNRE